MSLTAGRDAGTVPRDQSGWNGRGSQYPLTGHKGYNFAGWVLVNSTGTLTLEKAFTAYDTLTDFKKEAVDYKTLPTGNLVFKAGYIGNTELNFFNGTHGGVAGTKDYYSPSHFTFSRVGNVTAITGDYAVTFVISRENVDGYGTNRAKIALLRIKYTIGSVTMYMQVALTGKDVQTVEMVVPRGADSFDYAVVDSSTATSYVSANARSNQETIYAKTPGTLPGSGTGFILDGTLGYLREIGVSHMAAVKAGTLVNEWATYINAVTFSDLDLTELINGISVTPPIQSFKEAVARNRLLLYMAGKGGRVLTLSEVKEAVSMDTGTNITFTATAAYLGFRVKTLEDAYIQNGGELTVGQIKSIIAALQKKGVALDASEIATALASPIIE